MALKYRAKVLDVGYPKINRSDSNTSYTRIDVEIDLVHVAGKLDVTEYLKVTQAIFRKTRLFSGSLIAWFKSPIDSGHF